MSLIDRINEITEHCEWAKNTIEDAVTFNLPKEQAEISRERRAHGALIDACKLIKELKQTSTELQAKLDKAVETLKYYANPRGNYVLGHKTYTRYRYDSETHEDAGYKLVLVGKRARATLKELGIENE